jgi:hypothetical protein
MSENERDCVWCASGRTQCPKHEPLAALLRRSERFVAGGSIPQRLLVPAAADFNDLADELRRPNLGLATTRELLVDLEARYRIGLAGVPTPAEEAAASKLCAILDSSTPEQLDYRTVDHG